MNPYQPQPHTPIELHPEQQQRIDIILDQYTKVILQKMYSNEDSLLDELQQKTIKLKQEIAFYRKSTTSENIDKLIAEKRHQKETQRLQLEIHWRNLSDKYKKLQQQQKKLIEDNKQSHLDIENIQTKITQLKQANASLQCKVDNLKRKVDNRHFMTEIKPIYISPYKFNPFKEDTLIISRSDKSEKNKIDFRLRLEDRTKLKRFNKENKLKQHESLCYNETNSSSLLVNKKLNPLSPPPKQKHFDIKSRYTFPIKENKQDTTYRATGQKYKQLMHYLQKPQVRQKVYDLLKKQSLVN